MILFVYNTKGGCYKYSLILLLISYRDTRIALLVFMLMFTSIWYQGLRETVERETWKVLNSTVYNFNQCYKS